MVLIGEGTCEREFVKYELQKSFQLENKILGIFIHNIEDKDGNTCKIRREKI
ncbi:MAG: TIR domain-containing protein [Elusimicrobiota bacterium]|nr:TIR domain-containing protein [Elusimicrobiota bacterium]